MSGRWAAVIVAAIGLASNALQAYQQNRTEQAKGIVENRSANQADLVAYLLDELEECKGE